MSSYISSIRLDIIRFFSSFKSSVLHSLEVHVHVASLSWGNVHRLYEIIFYYHECGFIAPSELTEDVVTMAIVWLTMPL